MKIKRPAKYSLPLRSRRDIETYLTTEQGNFVSRGFDSEGHFLFCFNVKIQKIDFSFDAFLAAMREYEQNIPTRTDDPYWDWRYCRDCCERYTALFGSEDMGEINNGISSTWSDYVFQAARDHFIDQSHILFSGKEVKCEFTFLGRESGWMVLKRFEGIPMDGPEAVIGMEYQQLRRLYELVVMLGADYHHGKAAKQAVMMIAVSHFFGDNCNDIPKPAQRVLAGAH